MLLSALYMNEATKLKQEATQLEERFGLTALPYDALVIHEFTAVLRRDAKRFELRAADALDMEEKQNVSRPDHQPDPLDILSGWISHSEEQRLRWDEDALPGCHKL